jgi:hypothetical protein
VQGNLLNTVTGLNHVPRWLSVLSWSGVKELGPGFAFAKNDSVGAWLKFGIPPTERSLSVWLYQDTVLCKTSWNISKLYAKSWFCTSLNSYRTEVITLIVRSCLQIGNGGGGSEIIVHVHTGWLMDQSFNCIVTTLGRQRDQSRRPEQITAEIRDNISWTGVRVCRVLDTTLQKVQLPTLLFATYTSIKRLDSYLWICLSFCAQSC